MPKLQKNKNEKTVASNKHQSSLSKYFFTSTSNSATRKRVPPLNFDEFSCSKAPKLCNTSNEPLSEVFQSTDLDPQNLVSSEEKQELTQNVSSLCNATTSSETTKGKLLSYAYNKNKKSDSKSSELSKYGRSTDSKDSESVVEMDIDESERVDDDVSVKKLIKYTPLEKQYLEFQAKYPDVVLLIECGYKYRFFGKDAEIASKDLNIGCYQYHNFLSASIPAHRVNYHVRRLVLKNHKVGIIKQTESAALKAAGETRNELFTRELYAMYSKSTFIEGSLSVFNDENSVEVDDMDDSDTVSGFLICVNEANVSKNQPNAINIACIAVQVSSGDIYYSSYQDSLNQNELENYLICMSPSEIILPTSSLSKKTENLLKSFSCDRCSRIERLDDKVFENSFALNDLSTFISSHEDSTLASSCESQDNLQILLSLPPLVISCLSAVKAYLTNFKVENILKNVKNMKPFSQVDHMTLNATTIRGLDILRNNSSSSSPNYGTLWWSLNHTATKFGERLLKSWITKPLTDFEKIEDRLNIITELIHTDSLIFQRISGMLNKLPDLERLLCAAFYHKCNCYGFLKLVTALSNIKNELFALTDRIKDEIEFPKLKSMLLNVVKYLEGIDSFRSNIDPVAAKEENKVKVCLDTSKYTYFESCKSKISAIETKLSDLRPAICKVLRLPAFKYATVAGQKFLIEVPNSHLSLVPDEWLKYSVTKQVSRFRSPEVINLCKELEQEEERLLECAQKVWEEFLREFEEQFFKYKHAISNLAEIDCYLSFAKVSKSEKYCRPVVLKRGYRQFKVQQGRHPMIVKLIGEQNQFVSNDLSLDDTVRCLLVTGPNMGGKSTYIRQTALIALMAHIGCFVPAETAVIPLLDGIYVRMGADDDIVSQKSTFMTEMSEAASILSSATSNSLVILDELGRGTSTNDGAAIAYATLEYLVREVQCFTLFVTHYPPVIELKNIYPENIHTVQMAYILRDKDDENDIPAVTFLYNIVAGVSEKSYGINVAALAGISKDILIEAQRKSKEMEFKMIIQRQLRNILEAKKSEKCKGHK